MNDSRKFGPLDALLLCAGGAMLALVAVVAFHEAEPPPTSISTAGTRHDPALVAAVEAALSPPLASRPPTRGSMLAELTRLGPDALPVSVALLLGELQLPQADSDPSATPVDPRAIELRPAVLEAHCRSFPADDVFRAIQWHVNVDDLSTRLAAVRLLGRFDGPEATARVFDLIEPIEPIHLQRESVWQVCVQALAGQVERRGETLDLVRSRLAQTAPSRAHLYLRVLGRVRTAPAARALVARLGVARELDPFVLAELGAIGDAGRLALSPIELEPVRRLCSSFDPKVRRAAAIAAGHARDGDACMDLIGLLGDADPLVAKSAQWSLAAIAQTDLGPDAERWQSWLAAECEWRDQNLERLCAAMTASDPAAALDALSECVQHPLWRAQIAPALVPLAGGGGTALSAAARAGLERLGSHAAVQGLLSALESASADRHAELAAALQRLTGLNLGADPLAWRRALGA